MTIFNVLSIDGFQQSGLISVTDIKPKNILIETPEINDMLENAPPEILTQYSSPLDPPKDFYMESEPIISGNEDLQTTTSVSVKLVDFGVGT